MQISLNFKTSCYNLKIRCLGVELYVAFLLFQFWKELCFKVKESMHFVEQKQTLIKPSRNLKLKIAPTFLERRTLCFCSYKNRKLKIILWWFWARVRKKGFFISFILFERDFFLSQSIVYRIHFRIYIFLHIKKYCFMHFCCLFLKLSKAFRVSLMRI